MKDRAHEDAMTELFREDLAAGGNPELRSLTAAINTMGMRLAIQPLRHA